MSLINIEKTITLDVYDHDTTPSVIKAIQMDEGTRTVFAMIQNSRQDYDIGQNSAVSLTVLRPDKTKVQITGQPFVSYTGTDGTMYGAKAELSDVALAVKGNLKAQFKITSGEQELRTEIFTINNGEALDADDGDWAGDLDGHNLDEMAENIETLQTDMATVNEDVSELKSGLNGMTTATAEDVGKALKAKTVTDGKVTEWEFGEAGGADPEEIEQAVTDWLDDHPEATTTVEDGSLTVAKFTEEAQAQVLNDYVTPEMFGAKGDGTTDDTQALKDMFASNSKKYVFDQKTYMIDDAIDIDHTCTVTFNRTTIRAVKNQESVRAYEYMLGVKARIKTIGNLTLYADRSVNVCLWIAGGGSSTFDSIYVTQARIWGVYVDKSTADNNSLHFGSLSASICGYKFHAKAKYVSTTELEITDISNSNVTPAWNIDMFNSLFDNRYDNARFVIDDSGFTSTYLHNRLVYGSNAPSPFVMDMEDLTKATYTIYGNSMPKAPNNYKDGDNGRTVFIPIGGCVKFGSSSDEGVYSIDRLVTQSSPVGLYTEFNYGGRLGTYASEYDTVMMITGITYALSIGYIYVEALGDGYSYSYGNDYDKIMVIAGNSTTRINIDSPFIGTNRVAFTQANQVILYEELGQRMYAAPVLNCLSYIANRKLNTMGVVASAPNITMTEYSPDMMSITGRYFRTGNTITIELSDKNAYTKNMWVSKTIYVYHRNPYSSQGGSIMKIGLSDALLSAGYTMPDGTDNVVTIDTSAYNHKCKVSITLFDKEFFVNVESLAQTT